MKNSKFILLLSSLMILSSCGGTSPNTPDKPDTPDTYTITWKNYNGAILETDTNVESGTMPHYDGTTPTKEEDDNYTYTFNGWFPTLTSVVSDATYTATYTSTPKEVNPPVDELKFEDYSIAYLSNDNESRFAAKELAEAVNLTYKESANIDNSEKKIYLTLDNDLVNKYSVQFIDKSFLISSDTAIGLIEGSKSIYQHYLNNDKDLKSWYTTLLISDYTLKDNISIMSYNVRTKSDGTLANGDNGNVDKRGPRIAKAILSWLPDTVGIQEAGDNWIPFLNNLLGTQYGYIGHGRNSTCKGESSGIFYNRDKVTLLDSATKWLSDTPDVPGSHFDNYGGYNRIFTYGIFQRISDGAIYMHANTHLDLKKEPNALDAKKIDELISPFKEYMPVFVTGDYNCSFTETYEGWAYDVMTNELNYSDPRLEVSDTSDINKQTFPQIGYNSVSTEGGSIIDFCLQGNKGLHYTTYKVDNEPYSGDDVEKPQLTSDHYPIYLEAVPYTPIKGQKSFIKEHSDVEIDNTFSYHDKDFNLIKHQSNYDSVSVINADSSFTNGTIASSADTKTSYRGVTNLSKEGGYLEYKFVSENAQKADLNLVLASSILAYGGTKDLSNYVTIKVNDKDIDIKDINLRCTDVRQKYEWENLVIRNANLVEGENVLRIETKTNEAPDHLLLEIFASDYVTPIINDRPADPRDLFGENRKTIRIEAEDVVIIDPSEKITIGTDEKTLEETNNPSGDKFVSNIAQDINKKRASFNFFIKAEEAGRAVLSFGLGLDSQRIVNKMFNVLVNGKNVDYYSDAIAENYKNIQGYEWETIPSILFGLKEGTNSITVQYLGEEAALNLDYFEIDSEVNITKTNNERSIIGADKVKYTNATWVQNEGDAMPKIHGFTGYYGSTKNKTFTFEVEASEDCIALFSLFSARNKALSFDGQFSSFTLNDSTENYIKSDCIAQYNSWYVYYENIFAVLNLVKGTNTITFTIASGQSTNIAGLSFITTAEIQAL